MRGISSGGPSAKMAPVTMGLIATQVVSFLIGWASPKPVLEPLMFKGNWAQFWTAFTYPWASFGSENLIFFALGLLWIYSIGGQVEQEMGSRNYAVLFVALSMIGAFGLTLGLLATGLPGVLIGAFVPIAGVTAVWAARRPNAPTSFWGIPVAAKWIGVIVAAMVVIGYGRGAPIMGLFASLPCLAGALYGSGRLPLRYGSRVSSGVAAKSRKEREKEQREFEGFIDNVRAREQERAEKERLRKLFESSLDDGDEKSKSG